VVSNLRIKIWGNQAAEGEDFEFARFLLKQGARQNCRNGCKRCRFFVKMMQKNDKNARIRDKQERERELEELKMQEIERQD